MNSISIYHAIYFGFPIIVSSQRVEVYWGLLVLLNAKFSCSREQDIKILGIELGQDLECLGSKMFQSFIHSCFICIMVCNVSSNQMVSLTKKNAPKEMLVTRTCLTSERCSHSTFAEAAIYLPVEGNAPS